MVGSRMRIERCLSMRTLNLTLDCAEDQHVLLWTAWRHQNYLRFLDSVKSVDLVQFPILEWLGEIDTEVSVDGLATYEAEEKGGLVGLQDRLGIDGRPLRGMCLCSNGRGVFETFDDLWWCQCSRWCSRST